MIKESSFGLSCSFGRNIAKAIRLNDKREDCLYTSYGYKYTTQNFDLPLFGKHDDRKK